MDRESFLARDKKIATTTVPLPDGSTATIKKLSQADVETIKRKYQGDDKALEGLRFIVRQTLADEDGKRILKDEDLDALASVDFETIQIIALEAMKFSGMTVPKN